MSSLNQPIVSEKSKSVPLPKLNQVGTCVFIVRTYKGEMHQIIYCLCRKCCCESMNKIEFSSQNPFLRDYFSDLFTFSFLFIFIKDNFHTFETQIYKHAIFLKCVILDTGETRTEVFFETGKKLINSVGKN